MDTPPHRWSVPFERVFVDKFHQYYTVSAGHEDVVRELIGAGADVNKVNDLGITPL
jgi:ankyrin repeat protein